MQQLKKAIPYLKIMLICLLVFYCFRSVAGQLSLARELVNSDGPFFADWENRFDIKYAALDFQDPLRPDNPNFRVTAESP